MSQDLNGVRCVLIELHPNDSYKRSMPTGIAVEPVSVKESYPGYYMGKVRIKEVGIAGRPYNSVRTFHGAKLKPVEDEYID